MDKKLIQALNYAKKGWYIFPLIEGGKVPLPGSAGFKEATLDIKKIKEWWSKNPNYNIGVRCGLGYNVMCFDVDKKNGKNGFLWLNTKEELPITLNQTTPSGGEQFIFNTPEEFIPCSADKIAPGIDIRGDGGYFVAPPSFVKKTAKYDYEGYYEWKTEQSPEEIEPANAPDWLLNEIRVFCEVEEDNKEENFKEYDNILSIKTVIEKYNIKLDKLKNGILVGEHPTHGSSNGKNFRVNLNNNVWSCYRHTKPNGKFVGGGSLFLVAMLEGIIDCPECMPKALNGDRFKKVIKVIEEKFGISKDKFNTESVEHIIHEINNLKEDKEKIKVIENLKLFTKRIAKLKEADSLMVYSLIKDKFKLTAGEVKIIKLEVAESRKSARQNKIIIDVDENGNALETDKNILSILEKDKNLSGVFCKDLFSSEIKVMNGNEWCVSDKKFPRSIKDDDILQVKSYIIDKYNLQYRQQSVNEAVMTSAVINNFDSLSDFLNNLKWDGVPRINNWLIQACNLEDNAYHRWVSKLLLVAAVRRALVPGIKFDHVVVLAGEQATLKSTLIETLASDEWYTTMKLDDKDKDVVQKMQGKWIIELGEGVPLRKKDMDELKMFLVDKSNKERFAYARHMETYTRRSIFVMTINPNILGYLPDPTGNRRFLPIRINEEIDIDYVKKNREQLFAEAMAEHNKKFRIFLDNKEDNEIIEILKQEHKHAEVKDDWEFKIINWLITDCVVQKNKTTGFIEEIIRRVPEKANCLDIWTNVFNGDPATYEVSKQGKRIGAILTRLGLKGGTIRDGDSVMWGYRLSEFSQLLKERNKKDVDNQITQIEKEPIKEETLWEEEQ